VYQGYLSVLLDVHTLDIEIFDPYAQISDEVLGYISELPDIHIPDIGIFGPYAQNSDGEQGDFSERPISKYAMCQKRSIV
jgi:hypothetical protein